MIQCMVSVWWGTTVPQHAQEDGLGQKSIPVIIKRGSPPQQLICYPPMVRSHVSCRSCLPYFHECASENSGFHNKALFFKRRPGSAQTQTASNAQVSILVNNIVFEHKRLCNTSCCAQYSVPCTQYPLVHWTCLDTKGFINNHLAYKSESAHFACFNPLATPVSAFCELQHHRT